MMRNLENTMEFGEKLHNIRISRNLSQEELAEKTGVSRRSIQNYESGKMLPKKRSVYSVLAALRSLFCSTGTSALSFVPMSSTAAMRCGRQWIWWRM